MNLIEDVLRNLLLVAAVLLFVVLLSGPFGRMYMFIFNEGGGSWIGADWIAGFISVYILFTAFIFSTWGDKYRYWWISVLLIPSIYLIYSIDLSHILFDILLALIGLGIGEGLRKLLLKNKQQT